MASLAPGTILQGRYRIESAHDSGGSAMVYTAARVGIDDGAGLAVKEVDPAILEYNEFENEARLLYSLNHPNIPKVYDFFTEDGKYYLVMEFIAGTSLETLVIERGQGLNPRDALQYGLQICDVFSYLHGLERKVIHRDLKPGNLMLTRDGSVKLIDFGIARTVKADQKSDTLYAYSAYTASPEQKANLATDERSDIYSFGATLYCLIAGEAPPQSITDSEDGRDPALAQVDRRAPGLGRVIWKCMRYEPGDRYPSFTAVRDELSELALGTRRRVRRRRWLGLAVGVLTLAVAVGGGLWLRDRLQPAPPVVVDPGPLPGAVVGTSEAVADRVFSLAVKAADRQSALTVDGAPVPDSRVLWIVTNALDSTEPPLNGSGLTPAFTIRQPGVYEALPVLAGAGTKLAEPLRITVAPVISGPGQVVVGMTGIVTLTTPPDASASALIWRITDPDGKTSEQTATSRQLTIAPAKVGVYSIRLVLHLGAGEQPIDVASASVTLHAVSAITPDPSRIVNSNGSFTTLSAGFPDGWTSDGDGAVAYDSSTGHGGNGCLLFVPGGAVSGVLERPFAITRSGEYRLTAWVRTREAAGILTIRIRYRSCQNETFTAPDTVKDVVFGGGSQSWRQVLVTFPAPDTESNVEVHIDFGGTGQLWLDEVYVERP